MGNASAAKKQQQEDLTKPRRRLMDIVEDFVTKLISDDGEVTLDLEALEREMEDKGLGYQYVGRRIKQEIAGQRAQELFLMEELAKVKKRRERLELDHEDMRDRLGKAMIIAGKTEMITVLGKIYFQASPIVKLASDDWAEKLYKRDGSSEYVKVNPETYEAKKQLLMHDYKELHAAELEKLPPDIPQSLREATAKANALELMPEGFDVDENKKLRGI